ncbi:MAG: N-acetyltransferase [Butyricicoccus pullicaecorum]|nr:N-acetyltransferase [Butyricicoccus pullicaecorum]
MHIRQAKLGDHRAIYQMVKKAFSGSQISDGQEQNWIVKQRGGKGYIPQLELVAENQGDIIGHILMTVHEDHEMASIAPALYLAPLSVAPMFQRQGVGSALVKAACEYGAALGYRAVFLVGDPAYYSRFGFRSVTEFGLQNCSQIPDIYVQAVELHPDALKDAQGGLYLSA